MLARGLERGGRAVAATTATQYLDHVDVLSEPSLWGRPGQRPGRLRFRGSGGGRRGGTSADAALPDRRGADACAGRHRRGGPPPRAPPPPPAAPPPPGIRRPRRPTFSLLKNYA